MPRRDKILQIFAIAVTFLFLAFVLSMLLPFPAEGRGEGTHDRGPSPPENGHGGTSGAEGGGASIDAHGRPALAGSFGFTGLILIGVYLLCMASWAGVRRNWIFFLRHATVAGVMLLLLALYLNALGGFRYNGHTWNRSFANVSVILYAATLGIGPLARLWRPASHALPWRRETGIWATIAAVMHLGIFWEWSLGWSAWRRFFYPGLHGDVADTLLGDRASGLTATAFNVANAIGLVALAYALVLTITSNDASQRWLKRGWSWLQARATTMWLLVLVHAWIFAYYVEGPAGPRGGTLWASFWVVLLLQSAAFVKTAWPKRTTI